MKQVLLIAFLTLGTVAPAHGQLLYSDDFESYTPVVEGVGDTLATIGAPWGGPGAGSYSIRDGDLPFGENNQWVQMQAFGSPWTFTNNVQSAQDLTTWSIDLFFATDFANDGFVRFGLSQTAGNAGFIDVGAVKDPMAADSTGYVQVAPNQVAHLDIVTNVSDSAVMYAGGTIDPDTVDVWLDGTLVLDGVAVLDSDALDGVGIWINNNGTADMPVDAIYFDNIEYRNEAYRAQPFVLGDANNDGLFNNFDITAFVLALTDSKLYAMMFPDVDTDTQLDMNGDGVFNNSDITDFVAALTG